MRRPLRANRPMIARAVTDLPQPDSPTRQWVSPRFTVSAIPRTAATLLPKVTRRLVASRTAVIRVRWCLGKQEVYQHGGSAEGHGGPRRKHDLASREAPFPCSVALRGPPRFLRVESLSLHPPRTQQV